MNGDYYYWLKCSRFPNGYPTRIMGQLESGAASTVSPMKKAQGETSVRQTISLAVNTAEGVKNVEVKGKKWCVDADMHLAEGHATGALLQVGDMEYGVDAETQKPYLKVGNKTYHSVSKLGNSDDWVKANGTDGKWYYKPLTDFHLRIVRKGKSVTVYRDGLVDIKN